MTPFLQQVASVYINNELPQLADYCFVFPNKRSGVFFRHYLSLEAKGRPFIMPEIGTIAEVTNRFSALTEAPRLDQLFILYNEYRELSDDVVDFDQFIFWGEMLLNDFNDVDLYLVDPHKLFVNLKRFREVSSNYLTEEQVEIINRYWGERFVHTSPDEFWNHLHHQPTSLESKFLKLWEVLDTLFERFKNVSSTAGWHRAACLPATQSTTSAVEETPVCRLKDISSSDSMCSHWRKSRYSRNFRQKVSPISTGTWPRRHLPTKATEPHFSCAAMLSVFLRATILRNSIPKSRHSPTSTSPAYLRHSGQTKAAGLQLQKWIADGTIGNPANAIDTAVVLPDESLFIPMIHAVPPGITALNVTMGFPLKSTSISSLMSAIVALHLRASRSREEWSYFYEDLRSVLTHPLLQAIDPDGCNALLRLMLDRRLYMVPVSKITETAPALAFVFSRVHDTNGVEEVHSYFSG